MGIQSTYHDLRRWALRHCVPEWYWPDSIEMDGARIQIRNTPYSFGVKHLLRKGQYELPERTLISRAVRPGMQVLEFGSSIGIVSAILSHRVGDKGRVVSVEASSRLTDFSRTWLEKNRWMKVVNGFAFPVWRLPPHFRVESFLGDEVSLGGNVQFTVDGNPSASPAAPTESPTRTYDVGTLCREQALEPEVLVADIEGSEAIVLTCEAQLPESIRSIIMEMHPRFYPNGDDDMQRIWDAFGREGFKMGHRIDKNVLLQR